MTNRVNSLEELVEKLWLEREAKINAGEWVISEPAPLEDFIKDEMKTSPFQELILQEDGDTLNSVKIIDKDGVGLEFVGKFKYLFTDDIEMGTSLILKACPEKI